MSVRPLLSIISLIFASIVCITPLNAGTSITFPVSIPAAGQTDIADQMQDFLDTYGGSVANAFAIANIAGYPLGKAHVKRFFVGLSLNTGMANLDYFDDDVTDPNKPYPVFAVNPVVYLGIGLSKNTDFLGKIMLWSTGFYNPPLENDLAKLEKYNIYSIGGKFRYTHFKRKTILPGLFNFGGLTLSAGADMMYGVFNFTGQYEYTFESIDITPAVPSPADLDYNPTYDLEINWFIVSLNVQSIVYFELFWIFDFYTGLGMVGNYGYFSLDGTATGQLVEPTTPTNLGTLGVDTDNSYNADYWFPIYIVGLDINMLAFKITLESMVNLRNAEDVNVQIGTRIQF